MRLSLFTLAFRLSALASAHCCDMDPCITTPWCLYACLLQPLKATAMPLPTPSTSARNQATQNRNGQVYISLVTGHSSHRQGNLYDLNMQLHLNVKVWFPIKSFADIMLTRVNVHPIPPFSDLTRLHSARRALQRCLLLLPFLWQLLFGHGG